MHTVRQPDCRRKGGLFLKRVRFSDDITWKSVGLIAAGSLLFSAAMNLLIVPMALYSGGFLGVAQLLRELLLALGLQADGVDVAGIAYCLINVPLFFLSYRSLGKPFVLKTLIAVACYTVFLTVIVSPETPLITDRLTCCLLGGAAAGVGAGMTLLSGGCGGGEEILGVYLTRRRTSLSVGRLSILINLVVYGCCLIFFNLETVVYSLIYSVFANLFLDKMHFQNIMVNVLVISKKEGLQDLVFRVTGRGVTQWEGHGGYTDEKANLYLTVVSKRESYALRKALQNFDPDAFVVINEDIDVVGNFEVRVM